MIAGRWTLALVGLTLLARPAAADALFPDRIAPLLETRCLGCHNSQTRKGGLDLSTRLTALVGGDTGPVLVPGQPAASRLVQQISGAAPRMPRSGPKLSAAEVALVRRWVEAGVSWPEGMVLTVRQEVREDTWWSLRPLHRPALPMLRDPTRASSPIDAFILARLEARGLRPAPEADRRTLIRRLSFDLTGLPPTPEEIDAFLANARPDAYERIVERLLASPAYGERWGRHWLDVARYADTHGYDKDKRRDHAWPYRDWVIRSLNADLPYRAFVREQIAGDVLRPGEAEGTVAAAFVTAGPWDFVGQVELREGTVDKEKTRVLDRDDMVSSTLGTFLSLTVGCARCHNHKFDPIALRDYYRLQAVFAGVERGNRPLPGPTSAERQRLADEQTRLRAERSALFAQRDAASSPTLRRLDADLAGQRQRLAGLPAPSGPSSPTNGYHSHITATPEVVKWVQVDLGSPVAIDAIRLFPARPTDFPDTPGFGFPPRFRVEVSDDAGFSRPQVVADHTRADHANPGDVPLLLPLHGRTARFVRVTATRLWKRTNDYCFALAELQVDAGGTNRASGKPVTALDSIDAGRWSRANLVDGFDSRRALPIVDDTAAGRRQRQRLEIAAAIGRLESERRGEAAQLLPAGLSERLATLDARLADLATAIARQPAGPMVYGVLPIRPRPIHVLKRGSVESPGEEVGPAALSCLPDLPAELTVPRPADEGQRRLALADWVADGRNVLTWRSAVNRVWHHHFGKGIVDTPSDFGRMGGLPSHPELLDWLAVEFRDSGGALKALHRRIVTSAVYRQASRHDEAAARLDGDNRLLWRMNRRRLDAESLRDTVLAVSGRLDRRPGGPGYDLFRFKDDHSPTYDHADPTRSHDPATYRRTVYRFTVRSVPNPFLDCLDCADPNQPTPVRNTTLTALQALTMLNNPFMVRQATYLADRLAALPDRDAQVRQAFLLLFGRLPTADEARLVAEHIAGHGLASACRLLFNANEFLFVD